MTKGQNLTRAAIFGAQGIGKSYPDVHADGSVRLAKSQVVLDGELFGMDFHVEGITTEMPH